jgi:hypothetical protein
VLEYVNLGASAGVEIKYLLSHDSQDEEDKDAAPGSEPRSRQLPTEADIEGVDGLIDVDDSQRA